MKKTLIVASGLALLTTLSACEKKADAPTPAPTPSMMSGSMPMAGAMKHGQAVGTVTAIDLAKGTITLDHGAMTGLDWPAMTMGFAATPQQLAGIKVGDKVDFEIDWDGKAGKITKIAKTN